MANETPSEETKQKNPSDSNGSKDRGPEPQRPKPAEPKSKKPWIIAGTVVGIGLVIGIIWLLKTAGTESTDDAFVDAHIIPISAKVAGEAIKVYVDDNQMLKASAPLVDIDPRDYQAALAQARAKVLSAEADARRAEQDAKRYRQVFERDEISRQQLDNADATAATAKASLEQQRAAFQQAQLNLSYTKILAPEDGRVTKKNIEEGSYLQVGQSLLSIVPEHVWVTANFKETQLTHLRSGQHVRIKVDTYPGKVFEGHVDSIQSGTGERFSAMPAENATGNFVKVVQRVPVKILIDTPPDPDRRLVPGMSCVPVVTVKE